jgi:hypothetical protein
MRLLRPKYCPIRVQLLKTRFATSVRYPKSTSLCADHFSGFQTRWPHRLQVCVPDHSERFEILHQVALIFA